jgi:hypothetical protein
MWNADCGMRIENYKNQPRKHEIQKARNLLLFFFFRVFKFSCFRDKLAYS